MRDSLPLYQKSLKNSDTEIMVCSRCYEFLKEVNRFRIKRRVGDDNLHVKPLNIELAFNYENSSALNRPETILECNNCTFKSNQKQHMIAHRIIHDKINFIVLLQRYESIKENTGNYAEVHLYKDAQSCNLGIEEEFVSTEPFVCDFCLFTTPSNYKFKDHMVNEHANMYQYACDHCKYKTNVRRSIVCHLKKHTIPKYHKCSECLFESRLLREMTKHYYCMHIDDKPFFCDQCDYRGNLKYNLMQHKKKHLLSCEKIFNCDECSYETFSRKTLNKHIANKHCKIEKVAQLYFCDQCDYSCKYKKYLKTHMKTHGADMIKSHPIQFW